MHFKMNNFEYKNKNFSVSFYYFDKYILFTTLFNNLQITINYLNYLGLFYGFFYLDTWR